MGSHSHLQGIFLTQGWNPGLLHCRWILYCLSHLGSSSNWKKNPVNNTRYLSFMPWSNQKRHIPANESALNFAGILWPVVKRSHYLKTTLYVWLTNVGEFGFSNTAWSKRWNGIRNMLFSSSQSLHKALEYSKPHASCLSLGCYIQILSCLSCIN